MPLTTRPTGLSSPVDNDRQDFTVYCGGWAIGRIYEHAAGLTACAGSGRYGVVGRPPKAHMNGDAATLDEAKARFGLAAMAGVGEAA